MRTVALCSMVLAGALVIGCDKKTDNKPAPAIPAVPATPATPNHNTPTPEAAGHEAVDKAADKAAGLGDAAAQQAKEKLAQVMEYIKDNKLDLAEKALAELESMKDKLPEAIQSQLANARTALNAAKASKGGMPSLPGAH